MALAPFPDPVPPDDTRPDDIGIPDSDGGKMSFLDHLDELRKRLLIAAGSLVLGFLVAFAFISPIFRFHHEAASGDPA